MSLPLSWDVSECGGVRGKEQAGRGGGRGKASKAAETEARELESWSEDKRDGDRERHQEEREESLVRERHRNQRHRGWVREVDTQNQSPRIKGDTEYRE